MKKRIISLVLAVVLSATIFTACSASDSNDTKNKETVTELQSEKSKDADAGQKEGEKDSNSDSQAVLEDGEYEAEFKTDSSMFHVNEMMDGKGTLTVQNGEMSIRIVLVSKRIVNLFVGLAEDAKKDGAKLLEPVTVSVDYQDGTTEEVYGFDVPVNEIGKEFDLAILGESGKWFDHKVSVENPVPVSENSESSETLSDGVYNVEVSLEGGSGRASVESPCKVEINGEKIIATITWSSPNYDFMIVDDEKYLPVNTEGNSVFEIPISGFDKPNAVQADTVAMSKPYLIDYTLTFTNPEKQAD